MSPRRVVAARSGRLLPIMVVWYLVMIFPASTLIESGHLIKKFWLTSGPKSDTDQGHEDDNKYGGDGDGDVPWMSYDQFDRGVDETDLTEKGKAPAFPDEEHWLLKKVPYDRDQNYRKHGQLIPKRYHKVLLTTSGGFSKATVDLMRNDTIRNLTQASDFSHASRLPWAHRSWKTFNPGYEGHYFNLHYCRSYLRKYFHPVMLRAFDCIEAFSGKSDLFRFLVVYREGGFYSDWKQECMVDHLLDRLAENNVTWVSALDGGLPKHWHSMQPSFFGATPRHPILIKTISIVLHNIQSRQDLNPATSVYELTSSLPLGRAYREVNPLNGVPNGARIFHFKAHFGLRFFLGNEVIIVHKCYNCGMSQNWTDGNNYILKHKAGEFLCPDAKSLFRLESPDANQLVHGTI